MVSLSWEGNDVLKGIATQLAGMLGAEGKKEREAWEILHGKVAEVATSIADPKMSVEASLGILLKELTSPDLGHTEAQMLLGQIAMLVHEKVSAQKADASKAISLLKNMILLVADQLSMLPLRNSIHLDMVDGDTNFSEENVGGLVKCSSELSATKAPYSVVSIVGAQSSGKSYLLNQLFGSMFPVMNFKLKRSQTTKGILITRCIEPSLLVLDIEGFDGRERGEDKAFEKKAALFALTVSDLMMVNISHLDIGRQDGGSMGLFKTIFQERTKLDPGLTRMLVIIRNCNKEARETLQVLRQDVIETLEEAWKSVNGESVSFKEYIEINVVGLPDKESEDFHKEVTKLRKYFSSSRSRSAKVPAQSFSFSSKMLWDKININERLDLPSHMVLLATLFCQKAAETCIEQFDGELLKAEEVPQRFKETSDTLLANILVQYNQETEMYDAGVRDKEREKIVDNINKIFTHHSRELIKKIQQNTSDQFKVSVKNLENMEEKDGVVVYDENIVEPCAEKFTKFCEDLKVFDPDYFHEICTELRKQLTSHTVLHILSVNEDRARKNVQLALERADKNVQELILKLDQKVQEKQHREEEIQREKEGREEEIKREKEAREDEIKREKEAREEDIKREKEAREQEELKKAKEDVERREKMLEEAKSKMAAEEATRKEKEAKEDLERREKMLEEAKVKMAAEEAERKDKALQNDLAKQQEQIRILQLELARQVQQQSSGSSWNLFGLNR